MPANFLYGLGTNFVVEIDNCNNIGSEAFSECKYIRNIVYTNFSGEIGSNAFSSAGLKQIHIPEGTTKIGDYAFNNCNPTEVIIPEGVIELGNGSFSLNYNSSVSIIVPRSVTTIGYSAFYNAHIHVYSGSYAETWAIENGADYSIMVE